MGGLIQRGFLSQYLMIVIMIVIMSSVCVYAYTSLVLLILGSHCFHKLCLLTFIMPFKARSRLTWPSLQKHGLTVFMPCAYAQQG